MAPDTAERSLATVRRFMAATGADRRNERRDAGRQGRGGAEHKPARATHPDQRLVTVHLRRGANAPDVQLGS